MKTGRERERERAYTTGPKKIISFIQMGGGGRGQRDTYTRAWIEGQSISICCPRWYIAGADRSTVIFSLKEKSLSRGHWVLDNLCQIETQMRHTQERRDRSRLLMFSHQERKRKRKTRKTCMCNVQYSRQDAAYVFGEKNIVRCTVYSVQCAMYSVQFTMLSLVFSDYKAFSCHYTAVSCYWHTDLA